jgi:hypothetical protein
LVTGAAARLIHASTAGHPLLVSLAADYLREREWRFTTEEVEGLLRGEHAEPITDEVLDRIMNSLADQQRELLYRLTLPVGAFLFDVVTALAQVAPIIDRPREKMNRLLGAWVQRDAERQFIVSPLVRRVGSEGLTAATKMRCHLSLGELIVRETMNIYQAQQAINHFCQAEAFNRAGSLFLYLLDDARTLAAGKDIGVLDGVWVESPLPERMDLNIRLIARGLQIAVLPKYGRPIDYVLADLDGLMAAATDAHSLGIRGVAVMAAVHLASRDPDRTLQYIGRALILSNAEEPGAEATFLGEGRRLEDMLWFLVPQIVTPARLARWLTILESLPVDRRQRLLTEEDAFLGCIVVADRLRLAEALKPEGQRQWEDVLDAVDDLRVRASAMGSGALEAAAIRTLLSIHGEHLQQLDNAVPIAVEAIERLQGDPWAIFMAAGMLGRQYAFAGRHDEGRPMLEMALAQSAGDRTHERMMTLLAVSECFGSVAPDQSIQYAQRAVQLARSEVSIPVIEATRAGAELTTALFLRTPTREGATAVFPTWSEAAERLLEGRDDSDEWKDLFVIFAHQTSYLTLLALRGQPPSAIESGEEFAAPIRGVFPRTSPGRVALYRPSSVSAVMWMLSQFAGAAGDDQAAAMWLGRVSSLTDPTRLRPVEAMIGHDMIPSLVTSAKFAEAADAALRYCHANHLLSQSRIQNQDEMEHGVDIAASWNALPAAEREMIERRAALLAVLPAACWVFRQMLENQALGIAQGRSLASACRQISSTATDPILWNALADTLDMTCQERASGQAIVALGNTFASSSRQAAAILAYFGASLHGGPDDAFNAQLAAMQTLFLAFPPTSAAHRQLLLPFIERFWTTTFDQRRFGFSNPSLVEESLAQARQVPLERRIKAILRAVRFGVTSRADVATTAWLNADG